jgi:predicted HTH transcriptional regulator
VIEQEFESLLALGHETDGVEFKGHGDKTDPSFLAAIIRAMLGMANRRDGGIVILGVDSETLEPEGFDSDEVRSWLNYDDLAARVNEHASPSISFDLEPLLYRERWFVIVRVHEFADIPILCQRDFQAGGRGKHTLILRRGACYVRSRHKPETSEIPSEEEMRELLDLAIDKGVRKFVARAQRAGLFPAPLAPPVAPPDDVLFERQIKEME